MTNQQRELIRDLNDLLAVQHDHLRASSRSAARLIRGSAQATTAAIYRRHRRHIHDLAGAVREYGGCPRTSPDARRLPQLARVTASEPADESVLDALRQNAQELASAYAKTASHPVPREIARLLVRHAAEIDVERSWIEATRSSSVRRVR